MKKFIDKLISRLEEEQEAYSDTTYYAYGIGSAIKIVNQLAEEYNNGWIACSERLPKEDTAVQITYKVPYYKEYECNAFAYRIEDVWFWLFTDEEVHGEVLAWKETCEPYQPKEGD